MTKTLDFIFDFGSPNAYLVHQLLPDLVNRTGAQVRYIPCLLGGIFKSTGNRSPIEAYSGIPAKLAYERLEMQRFLTRHRLTKFRFNPHFPVNTLLMMRGAVAADQDGKLLEYCDAGFRAMWENGKKMDDPDVFSDEMTRAGLNGQSILRRTQDSDVKAQLIKATEAAVARGVFGVPTFFVGDEMFFGKERLGQLEEALTSS